jgi:hypothetical protein
MEKYQTDMNDLFKPLDSDNDVLTLDKDTFTVGRLKELVAEEIRMKFVNTQVTHNDRTDRLYSQDLWTISIGRESNLGLKNIQFREVSLNCQLLKVGSQGWQKGKLRTQVCVEVSQLKIEVSLEFSPDEPTVPESPLDDLRQLPEYKQQP